MLTMPKEEPESRTRAEDRRITIAKFKLYSVLARLPESKWTAHEHAIMSSLENDPEVAKAIMNAIARQQHQEERL